MKERVLSCDEALRYLSEYLDGELEVATDRDVESHLARCRSCYSRADFERRLKTQVAALGRSDLRPDFADRMRQLLQRFAASGEPPEAEGR